MKTTQPQGTLFDLLEDENYKVNPDELKKSLTVLSKINKLQDILSSCVLEGKVYTKFFEEIQLELPIINIKIELTEKTKKTVLYKSNENGKYQYLFKNSFNNTSIEISISAQHLSKYELLVLGTYCKEMTHIFCIYNVINSLQQSNDIDPLTQLQTRVSFNNELKRLIPFVLREKMKLGVVLINIDRFRAVNDEHGDDFGDQFLKLYSDTIRHSIRSSDMAIRFGGGEFLVILLNTQDIKSTLETAEKLKCKLTKAYILSPYNDKFQKTVSVGVSLFPDDSKDIHEVIKFAEMALCDAKETGRNKLIRYENSPRGSFEIF